MTVLLGPMVPWCQGAEMEAGGGAGSVPWLDVLGLRLH